MERVQEGPNRSEWCRRQVSTHSFARASFGLTAASRAVCVERDAPPDAVEERMTDRTLEPLDRPRQRGAADAEALGSGRQVLRLRYGFERR